MSSVDSYLARGLILVTLIVAFTTSASALSCETLGPPITVHCPTEGACESDINATDLGSVGVLIESEEIPDPGEVVWKDETGRDQRVPQFGLQTERNRELPSAETALSSAKSLCPGDPAFHLYPKESFQKQELDDTTDCYTTRIQELEDYYLVWREGTTESWWCMEKVRGSRISGGERHYAAPIDIWWLAGKFLEFLIPI